jgi:hypothetical protein
MQVVNDQIKRFVQRIEVDEQPLDRRRTAKVRSRVSALDQPRRIGKRMDDCQPEVLCILLAAVDPDPGDALAEVLDLDPRSQQLGLTASGGGADQDHGTAGYRREKCQQPLAADHPTSSGELRPGPGHEVPITLHRRFSIPPRLACAIRIEYGYRLGRTRRHDLGPKPNHSKLVMTDHRVRVQGHWHQCRSGAASRRLPKEKL